MPTPSWRSRYSDVCLEAVRGCAVLAAAVLPFSTAATNVLLGLMLIAWLVSGRLCGLVREAARHPVAAGAAAVLCWMLLATLWSDATAIERAHALSGYRKLLLLIILLPLFDTPRRRAALLFGFLAGCVALLATSIATYFGVGGLEPDAMQGAIVTRNHITHGLMMALLAFAMATLAFVEVRLALRAASWLIAWLALLNLTVMTHARTGWFIVFGLLLTAAAEKGRWPGAVAAAVAVAVLGSFAYVSVPSVQQRVGAALNDVEQLVRGNVVTSTGIRLHFHARGIEIVKAHPVFGAGTGAWRIEYERRSADDPESLQQVSGLGNAHSDYVTMAVQFGLFGLFAYFGLLAALFMLAKRLPGADMWLARGLIVAYAVGAIFNSFLWDFAEGHIVVLLLIALFGGRWPPSADARPALSAQHLLDLVNHARRRQAV